MTKFRNDRLKEAVLHIAQEFVNRESNRTSLVTVTNVDMDDDAVARIFVSVFPPEKTSEVIDFLMRTRADFVDFFKKSIRVRSIPHITFMADPNMGSNN